MSLFNTLKHLVNHPLNKPNKMAAIIRFLKWQAGSRLVPGGVIYQWVNKSMVVVRPGEDGITGNIYCGLHEFPDMAFLLHTLRANDLFVDIGANAGSYTILACSAIGARGYCFEPVPSTYERLMTNIRLNNIGERVVALNIALGNSRGKINFSSDQDAMNHVLSENEDEKNKIIVDVATLDDELIGDPFLMKIDVEGYETPMLKGAEKTLKNEELCGVIMELNGSGNRYGHDESEILSMMFRYGFKTYSYKPFERSFINLEGKNLSGGNTIFIRNMDRVLGRIQKAPRIAVHGVSI
ncbi:MAG: FkbM family methyltransferase [Pseudomonadota bacterium]